MIIRIILTIVLFLACPQWGFCMCAEVATSRDPIAIEKVYDQATQVFIGEVTKIDLRDALRAKVTFKIEKQYKGEKADEIVIFQSALIYRKDVYVEDLNPFLERDKYLVYAEGSGEQLTVSGCSRTRALVNSHRNVAKDIEVLDKIIATSNWKFDERKFREWQINDSK